MPGLHRPERDRASSLILPLCGLEAHLQWHPGTGKRWPHAVSSSARVERCFPEVVCELAIGRRGVALRRVEAVRLVGRDLKQATPGTGSGVLAGKMGQGSPPWESETMAYSGCQDHRNQPFGATRSFSLQSAYTCCGRV